MSENNIQVFTADTLADIFYQTQTIPGLKIVGNCTQLCKLPEKMLSTHGIKELSEISRNEQYIDAGAAVTLNNLIALGENKLPKVLYKALIKTANPHVRNLATIGGNICAAPIKGTLFAPLLALDAKIIMQNQDRSLSIPITKFSVVPEQYIVTKIRIPTDDWDIYEFSKIGPESKLTDTSASYIFLAKIENSVLTGIRIAFSGVVSFRSISIENRMVGTRLPLEKKSISALISEASIQFDQLCRNGDYNQLMKEEFLRLITYSFIKLT